MTIKSARILFAKYHFLLYPLVLTSTRSPTGLFSPSFSFSLRLPAELGFSSTLLKISLIYTCILSHWIQIILWNSWTPQTIICFTFCHQTHELLLAGFRWWYLSRGAALTFSNARLRFWKYFYVSKVFWSVTKAAIFIAVMITLDRWTITS